MSRAIIILLCLLILPWPLHAQNTEPKTEVRRLLHIELAGDLDAARIARDLDAELARARDKGAEMILLEVDGRMARPDVLRDIGRVLLAEPRLPLLVYLNPDGQPIGLGQAWLALLADPGCAFADPAARFELRAGDDCANLAPADLQPASIDEDLRTLAAASLTRRGGPILLTALCPRPTLPLWTASTGEGDGGLKIVTEEPSASEVGRTLATPDPRQTGAFRAAFTSDIARRIGLVNAAARGPGDALAQRHVNVWKTDRVRIASRLVEARRSAERALKSIDADRAAAKAALDATRDKLRSKNPTLIEQARSVARQQLNALNLLDTQIEQAEALTIDYPELLRSPPPGTTTLPAKAAATAADWRDAFQSRRTAVANLRSRAQTIIATPNP